MVQFNQNNSIMLTANAKRVSLDELLSMEHKPLSNTHYPTGFGDISMHILEKADSQFRHLGEGMCELVINRVKDGHHLLGKLRYPGDDGVNRLIAWRSSDNMDFATTVSGGGEVMMCANGMMLTTGTRDVRKNTLNGWRDFQVIVDQVLLGYEGQYAQLQEDQRKLREISCQERRGAELIGLAQYRGLLADTQANVARKEWKLPGATLAKDDLRRVEWQSDDGFGTRTAWSLYNAMTEGLKRGAPASLIQRHTKVHDWMLAQAA